MKCFQKEINNCLDPSCGMDSQRKSHSRSEHIVCLQAMKLACCNLRAVPDAICVMSQLRFLDLSMNEQLDSLPLGAYLDHIETLELSRCCFTRVRFTYVP
jgi:hypothetical protein